MKIKDTLVDIVLLFSLLFIIGAPAYYYSLLPEEIPMHFNAQGEVGQYGSKQLIWLLTGVGFLLVAGLRLVRDQKSQYNYPIKITDQNEEIQYQLARNLLQFIVVLCGLMFCAIIYDIIQVSLDYKEKGTAWVLPLFVILLFGGLIYYMKCVYKAAKN